MTAHRIDPSEECDNLPSGELTLWRAVINQALDDGMKKHDNNVSDRRIRDQARDWFRSCGPQYRYVCDLAGYNPHWLSAKALELFDKFDRGELRQKPTAKPSRTAKRYNHEGKSLTLVEWADATGVNLNTLTSRVNTLGWPIDRALTEPTHLENSWHKTRPLSVPPVGPNLRTDEGTGGGSRPCDEIEIGRNVQNDNQ